MDLEAGDGEAFFRTWLGISSFRFGQIETLAALLFQYAHVLKLSLQLRVDSLRPKKPERIPVVWSLAEAACPMAATKGMHRMAAEPTHGAGLRLSETLALRVQDLDFEVVEFW